MSCVRNRPHRWILAALCCAFALGVACTTTQTPGEQISDNSIQAAVKSKLTVDRFSNIVNVDVNVTNGVVTLAGEVPNAQVRAEAEAEARSVDGVKRVVNNLQISKPPTS
jgi:osmotically-inducible protein OsmY